MYESKVKPWPRVVLILFVALIYTSMSFGGIEKLTGLEAKLPGRVFLYQSDLGWPASESYLDSMGQEFDATARYPFSRSGYRASDPFPNFLGNGTGLPAGQGIGSERLKLLSRAFEEGGRAESTVAYSNHCYVGTSGSLAVFDVSDPKAPLKVHEIDEAARHLERTGTLMSVVTALEGAIVFYDISSATTPVEISRLSPPIGFFYEEVSFGGTLAAATGYGHLEGFGWCTLMQMIDISDTSAPEVVSSVLGVAEYFSDTLFHQNTLFLGVDYDGLVVLDITDPMWITQIGFLHDLEWICDMVYQNGYLFTSGDAMDVVDVSDPSAPELVAHLGGAWTSDIELANDIVYITDDDDLTLRIIDVSNPQVPVSLSNLPAYGCVWCLDVLGDKVYLPDVVYGLLVVDVSVPASPQLESMTSTGTYPFAVDVEDGMAAVSANMALLHTLDVSDPFEPKELGCFAPVPDLTPHNTASNYGVDLEDGTVVTSHWGYGLHTYDVTTPTLPQISADLKIGINLNPVARKGNLIYTGDSQLLVFDITDPANPVQVGSGPSFQQYLVSVRISGDTGYAAAPGEIVIFDLSNPVSPQELARITASEFVKSLAIEENLLGVYWETEYWNSTGHASSLELYDVSNPSAPALLSTLEFPYPVLYTVTGNPALSVDKGRFFLASSHFVAIDAQDPHHPYIAAAYSAALEYPYFWLGYLGACAEDGLIYLAGLDGLEILRFLDVGIFLTPPSNPVVVSQGDSFSYKMKVENFTTMTQTVHAWIDSPFSSGPMTNPSAAPMWMMLGPGESKVYMRKLQVPAGTPPGTYYLYGHVSSRSGEVLDNQRITIEVVP